MSDWGNDPLVTSADWGNDPIVTKPSPVAKPQPSIGEQALGGFSGTRGAFDPIKGIAEGVGSVALGAAALPVSGLAGLGAAAAGAVLPGPEGQARNWGAQAVQSVQGMVPQPTTALGRGIEYAAGVPEMPFNWLAKTAGQALESFSPVAATAAQTLIEAAPMALSRMIPGESAASVAAREGAQKRASLIDAASQEATDAGYVLLPSQRNPSPTNKLMEGASGKTKLAQDISIRNQDVTDSLVRDHFGIEENKPIVPKDFADVRKQAGKVYEEVASFGRRQTGPEYRAELDRIVKGYEEGLKDFPESKASRADVVSKVRAIDVPSFDTKNAITQIRSLRNEADQAYAAKDKILGNTYRDMAYAIEDEVGRKIEEWGDAASPDVIRDFQEARRTIAETYMVQGALKEGTGHIDAAALGKALDTGKPLRGNLATVGRFAMNFPKARQLPEKIGGVPASPLDYAAALALRALVSGGGAGAAIAGGHPYLAPLALVPFARPLVRNALMSEPYQRTMLNPSYSPSTMNVLSDLQRQPLTSLAEIAQGQRQ